MRGLVVPDKHEDFTADPVELFFDLAYVFAFSQLVGLLIHDASWSGAGEAALIFLLLWLPWSQVTWSANAVAGNSRIVRTLFLVATAASVPMAAAVPTALEGGGPQFAIPLSMISIMGIGLLLVGAEQGSANYRAAVTYSIPTIVAFVMIIVGGFLHDGARVAAWIIGLLIFIGSTIKAGGGDWVVRSGHFAERHGLIVIVASGEVIVAIGKPLVDSIGEGAGFSAQSITALTAAGVFAGLLWWAYFDRAQPSMEFGLERTDGRHRGRYARDVYTYGHIPIVAGIIASAAALEEITLHPTDPLHVEFRVMLFVGLGLFFGGVAIAVYRAFRVIARERVVGGAVAGIVLVVGADLNGVALLLVLDLLILVLLIVENQRVEHRQSTADDDVARSGSVDH